MGLASSSRRAKSRGGGGTMRNSHGEKNFFLEVLAPSRRELKIFMGLASSSCRAISRGGGAP